MGKPAAKKGDKIVSVTAGDVHIILIPSPAGPVPTPIPHPCKSDITSNVASKVNVQGKPGAVKGSKSRHMPVHIPQGGPFQKPPANAAEVVTGSSNVNYENKPAAMLGDTGKMCADPTDAPVGVLVVPPGTVYIGGGMSGGAEAREKARAEAMKAAAAACHTWINTNMPPGTAEREEAHRAVCTTTGHPVDVATGKLVTRNVELRLPGRIPVEFVRNYSSARREPGPLGVGWRHSYQISLLAHPDFVALRDENGRFIAFPPPPAGGEVVAATDPLTLARTNDGRFTVTGTDGLRHVFLDRSGAGANGSARWLALEAIESPEGPAVRFLHRGGRLEEIVDTAGRSIRLHHDADGRLHQLLLAGVAAEGQPIVRRYRYDAAGDLIAVADEAGQVLHYRYADHLLTRETDRNGFSFCFAYDERGWCVGTWGDGDLHARRLDYDRERRLTRVVDGEGATVLYRWNERGVVELEQDANGQPWAFDYDDGGRRVRTVDPGGNEFAYAYDERGLLVERVDPEGNTIALKRDDRGRTSAQTDAAGRTWTLKRDRTGALRAYTAPDGAEARFAWDARTGDLIATRDPLGRVTRYVHDRAGNTVERVAPNGLRVRRAYDARGRLLEESDDHGVRVRLAYEANGRVVREEHRDFGVRRYEHDAEGNPTRIALPTGRIVEIAYGRFNQPLRRTERAPDGATRTTEFAYDSENRPREILYPGGERAAFRYDAAGRLVAERTADGRRRRYRRDHSGFLIGVRREDGRDERWRADGLGRTIERRVGDDAITIGYAAGAMAEAESDAGRVAFTYDALNRVVEEAGPHGTVGYAFDAAGRLIRTQIGEVCALTLTWRDDGYRLSASPRGGLDVALDRLGRVTSVRRDNGVHEARRYDGGRRRPAIVEDLGARRRYRFDAAGRVAAIEDEGGSAGRRSASFERDGFDRLVRARLHGTAGALELSYGYDACGNRTPAGRRFTFAAGNRLEIADGRRLAYDDAGRISALERADGRLELEYDGFGRLIEARLAPDHVVRYTYDGLGRRVSKRLDGLETRFLWDGNRLAAEFFADGRERAYVYHGRRPYPLMMVERGGGRAPCAYYLHNDHRGCPEAVTDDAGEVVWRAQVDPFGALLDEWSRDGDGFHQPLALPGQYRDRETGLVCNLFRYYLPELTLFLAPDPLGHRAGQQLYAFPDDPISKADLFGLSADDYDQSKKTPHRIVEINGVKYVEFDAAYGYTSGSNVNPGGSGDPATGSTDHFVSIGPDGEVVVMEGRHRAVAAAAGDPIPEDLGGIPDRPGHLRYPLGEEGNFETTDHVGPSLLDLAMDPDKLDAARSGKRS